MTFFSSLFNQFFPLFFRDLFYLGVGLLTNISLSLRYFSTSCNTLSNSGGEISPFYIVCEMIMALLSNLLWASSLMESCFSRFMVKVLKYFHVMTVTRERSRLVPLKTIPKGRSTPLANAVIEIPLVITVDVIRPLFTMALIVLNGFIFLAILSRTSVSSSKYASISVNFLSDMFVILVVPQGLYQDKFCLLFHCRIWSFFI